jgi:hypothetical protein
MQLYLYNYIQFKSLRGPKHVSEVRHYKEEGVCYFRKTRKKQYNDYLMLKIGRRLIIFLKNNQHQ